MNWVLGFNTPGVLENEVGLSAALFACEVFVRRTSPAEARLRAFGGYGRVLDHTGIALFQRIWEDQVLADVLVRLDTVQGLWAPVVSTCPCSFSAWSLHHVWDVMRHANGSTKTLKLKCPDCSQRGKINAIKHGIQFVTDRISEVGKAYSLGLTNHFIVPIDAKLEITFYVSFLYIDKQTVLLTLFVGSSSGR